MSHAETIYAAYDAWTRRDTDALVAVVHPDSVARPILGANIGENVYRGHDGARRWLLDLHQEWELFEAVVAAIDERGDRALCTFRIRGRGRASGVEVDGELFHVMEFRDGLIVRLDAYRDREEAVAALDAT